MVSVSRVTDFSRTWAASHTRWRMRRCTSSNCWAIPRCSEARNRQKVHCGGKRQTFKIPTSIGSRSRNRKWFKREKPTYSASTIASTN